MFTSRTTPAADGHSAGAAQDFTQRTDAVLVELLGVDIVEVEHPGRTYHPGEPRGVIDAANRAADEASVLLRPVKR